MDDDRVGGRMNAAVRDITGSRWVLFALDGRRFALPLESVERIVRAAEVTPLTLAPPPVLGALDVGGKILPVFDLRSRFGLPVRRVGIDDQFIIARTTRRRVVLAVDGALGVVEHENELMPAGAIAPDLRHLRGVISLADGLVLIQDLERLLSPEESSALDGALRAEESRRAR